MDEEERGDGEGCSRFRQVTFWCERSRVRRDAGAKTRG
jgi:hypothetical protein